MAKCYKPLKASEVPEDRKGKVNWDFQNPLPSAILNWETENLPEQAGTLGLANQQTTTATQVDVSYGKQTPQPLWLLDKPVPVQIRNQQLYWHRPLKLISGPQRLCGNWWQNEQQRDYYLACDSKGARYWLFREAMDRRWFIHGLFA